MQRRSRLRYDLPLLLPILLPTSLLVGVVYFHETPRLYNLFEFDLQKESPSEELFLQEGEDRGSGQ
jgi:hypothetical protein